AFYDNSSNIEFFKNITVKQNLYLDYSKELDNILLGDPDIAIPKLELLIMNYINYNYQTDFISLKFINKLEDIITYNLDKKIDSLYNNIKRMSIILEAIASNNKKLV